jgi:arylsulfatase A-like enzyme
VDYGARIAGGPSALGFDFNYNITGSLDMAPYCFIQGDHTDGIPNVEKHPYNPQQREGLMTSGWQDDQVDVVFTAKAVEFIRRQAVRSPDQPFFLYLTPSAPHRPCVPPHFIRGKSQAGPRGDMVALIDWMVGEVQKTLEQHDLVDNTLIIVTSDNGARLTDYYGKDYSHKSCGDLRGQKADIWDGGHREPFIARWPGVIPAGSTSEAMICLGDLIATCADILDAELPGDAAEDSFSYLPALLGDKDRLPARSAIVHHSGDGMFSIREGRWKLILGLGSGGFSKPRRLHPAPGDPQGQLYDMKTDDRETRNLWNEKPAIVAHLETLLHQTIITGRSNATPKNH